MVPIEKLPKIIVVPQERLPEKRYGILGMIIRDGHGAVGTWNGH